MDNEEGYRGGLGGNIPSFSFGSRGYYRCCFCFLFVFFAIEGRHSGILWKQRDRTKALLLLVVLLLLLQTHESI